MFSSYFHSVGRHAGHPHHHQEDRTCDPPRSSNGTGSPAAISAALPSVPRTSTSRRWSEEAIFSMEAAGEGGGGEGGEGGEGGVGGGEGGGRGPPRPASRRSHRSAPSSGPNRDTAAITTRSLPGVPTLAFHSHGGGAAERPITNASPAAAAIVKHVPGVFGIAFGLGVGLGLGSRGSVSSGGGTSGGGGGGLVSGAGGMCSWPEVDDSVTNSNRTAKLELPMARQIDLPPAKVLPVALRADVLAAEEAVAAAVQLRNMMRVAAAQQAAIPVAARPTGTITAVAASLGSRASETASASASGLGGGVRLGQTSSASQAGSSTPQTTPAGQRRETSAHAEEAAVAATLAEIRAVVPTAETVSAGSTARSRQQMQRRDREELEAAGPMGQHWAHSAAGQTDLRLGRPLYPPPGSAADAAEPRSSESPISPTHGSDTNCGAVVASRMPLCYHEAMSPPPAQPPVLAANTADASRGSSVDGVNNAGNDKTTHHPDDDIPSRFLSAAAATAAATSYYSAATVANAGRAAAVCLTATPLAQVAPPPSTGPANLIAVTAGIVTSFTTAIPTNADGGCGANDSAASRAGAG
ncbi:hypothetical protein Vretifemale_15294, partial [Volvox reticuliferus]